MAYEQRRKEIKDTIEKLENGVKEVFDDENFKEYLKCMSKFHDYSYNNTLLIMMQKPDASYVAGYNTWKQLGRQVQKGEKGITILAPSTYRQTEKTEQIKRDENGMEIFDADGNLVKEYVEDVKTYLRFRAVKVFDISQTDGEPLPEFKIHELNGKVDGFNEIWDALVQTAANYQVSRETFDGGDSKGYCSPSQKVIVVRDGMSDLQTIKTLIHEIAHSKLHDIDVDDSAGQLSRNRKEVEAEAVAYCVASYLGIDTSDYSFGYIAGWSSGQELSELKSSLNRIQQCSHNIIGNVEHSLGIKEKLMTEQKSRIKNMATHHKADINAIKESISITDYAESALGFTVTKVGAGYSLKEHDSVRISADGRLYKRWSTGTGGSIIDFVSEMEGITVKEAIARLSRYVPSEYRVITRHDEIEKKVEPFTLPAKNVDNQRVTAYLSQTRCVDIRVIRYLLKAGRLYEEKEHHNAVFAAIKNNEPVRAIIAGTNTYKKFKRDMGDNSYPFSFGHGDTVYFYESPIDAMSHASLEVKAGHTDWNQVHRCALGGVGKLACIGNYLDDHPEICDVVFSYDNDDAGKEALQKSIEILREFKRSHSERSFRASAQTPNKKDWNDELCAAVNLAQHEREVKV